MTQIKFLDGLGRELDGAASRLIRGQRRRGPLVRLAPAAALAACAVIAVLLWPSAPLDQEREVGPAVHGSHEVGKVLAVARRPETAADRSPETRGAREALAGMVEGGDVTFRALGPRAVLAVGSASACIRHDDGDGGVCWPAEDIAAGRAYAAAGDRHYGLAPDGVTRVTLTVVGDERTVDVHENFYEVSIEFQREVLLVTMRDGDGRVVAENPRRGMWPEPRPVPEATLRQAEALAQARPGVEPEEIKARVPLPPDVFDDPVEEILRDAPPGGFETAAQLSAACIWRQYWLTAAQDGDERVAAQAAQVLATVPRWPGLRADAAPHERVAAAAAGGGAVQVARSLGSRDCG